MTAPAVPGAPAEAAPAAGSPLVDRVRAAVARCPDAVAVRGALASLRYRELGERLTDWSAGLRALGAPAGSVAALTVLDPTYLAPAFVAARAAGLVPLLVDPHMPPARRAAVLAAARPAVAVDVAAEPALTAAAAPGRVLPSGAGYLGFTSGTQGPPKGIVANERGALHFADWEIATLGLGPGRRVAMISPPTFEVIIRELYATLCSGGELHVAPAAVRADPAAVVPWLAERDVEVVHVVPSLSARWSAAAPGTALGSLRATVFAGEPLHAGHVETWRRTAPHSEMINVYGPSETTLAKFWYRVPDPPRPGLQPVGRPLPGTRLQPLALPGSAGAERGGPFQVAIATPHGSLGYLEGTASVADEAALSRRAGTTTFVSQDIGVLDDGCLSITGRLDSRVKRRGVFVDLARIEEAAAREPGVGIVCCLQTAPETGGTLVLAVEGDPAGVRRRLRRELGPESPDDVVAVPRIPLSPNGKIDRHALRDLLAAAPGRRP